MLVSWTELVFTVVIHYERVRLALRSCLHFVSCSVTAPSLIYSNWDSIHHVVAQPMGPLAESEQLGLPTLKISAYKSMSYTKLFPL